MLSYYFYNNINKFAYKFNIYIYLISLVSELHNISLNLIYLNKFFFSFNNYSFFKKKNNYKKFNSNIFFFKIYFLINILKHYISINENVKSWRFLLFFFFVTLNGIISKSSFFNFNFNINLTPNNMINYSLENEIILFKIHKRPLRFIIFYFYIYLYKLFLTSKNSLYIVKDLLYLDFDILNFFTLVTDKTFLNYKFQDTIYI